MVDDDKVQPASQHRFRSLSHSVSHQRDRYSLDHMYEELKICVGVCVCGPLALFLWNLMLLCIQQFQRGQEVEI